MIRKTLVKISSGYHPAPGCCKKNKSKNQKVKPKLRLYTCADERRFPYRLKGYVFFSGTWARACNRTLQLARAHVADACATVMERSQAEEIRRTPRSPVRGLHEQMDGGAGGGDLASSEESRVPSRGVRRHNAVSAQTAKCQRRCFYQSSHVEMKTVKNAAMSLFFI